MRRSLGIIFVLIDVIRFTFVPHLIDVLSVVFVTSQTPTLFGTSTRNIRLDNRDVTNIGTDRLKYLTKDRWL